MLSNFDFFDTEQKLFEELQTAYFNFISPQANIINDCQCVWNPNEKLYEFTLDGRESTDNCSGNAASWGILQYDWYMQNDDGIWISIGSTNDGVKLCRQASGSSKNYT